MQAAEIYKYLRKELINITQGLSGRDDRQFTEIISDVIHVQSERTPKQMEDLRSVASARLDALQSAGKNVMIETKILEALSSLRRPHNNTLSPGV